VPNTSTGVRHLQAEHIDVVHQAIGAQHRIDVRLVGDGGQFARAQQRHGGQRDAAGLDHAQDAGRHHRTVRAAQQHAAAGGQPEIVAQHVGNAVDLRQQLGVGEAFARADQRGARAPAARDGVIEQRARAVQALRVLQLGQVEQEVRPGARRRQVRTREAIGVAGGAQRCTGDGVHGVIPG
jgi:hypothetical protein